MSSWDGFERYKQKGLDARRAGQWDSARVYLLEAARAMVDLSKEAQGEELREARRQIATRLLELARDCESAKAEKRRQPSISPRPGNESTAESDGGASAGQWIVKEKPALRFSDVAGLDEVKQDL